MDVVTTGDCEGRGRRGRLIGTKEIDSKQVRDQRAREPRKRQTRDGTRDAGARGLQCQIKGNGCKAMDGALTMMMMMEEGVSRIIQYIRQTAPAAKLAS